MHERHPTLIQVREKKRRLAIGAPERWVNEATGESLEVTPTTLVAGDADFQKFWVGNILAAIDEISNAKIKVLWYIMRNIDPMTNLLLQTVQQIAIGSKTSVRTVIRTLQVLDRNDIVRRRIGFVQLNPNVMMTGGSGKRRAMLMRFEQLELPLNNDSAVPIRSKKHLSAVS